MRKLIAILCVVFSLPAQAQVYRDNQPGVEQILFNRSIGAASAAFSIGGRHLPRAVRISRVEAFIVTISGAGAGNTVITITDGANTCTATMTCVASSSLGMSQMTLADGAGSGCSYATNADLTASVTTAGCTTTQPGINTLSFFGIWK